MLANSKFFFAAIGLLLMACSSTPPPSPPDSAHEVIVSKTVNDSNEKSIHTFEELHQVASYGALLEIRRVDAQISKAKIKKILACDSKIKSSSNWMMKLKSLIDEKASAEQQFYLKLPSGKKSQELKFLNCTNTCLCGAYASIIYQIENQTPEDEALQKSLQQRHDNQTDSELLVCAQRAAWFCKSKLLNELTRE